MSTTVPPDSVAQDQTSAGELAEGEALFDLYLAAFDGATRLGTGVATHTHEAAGYDRLTGEVLDEIAGNGAGGAGDDAQVATERASSSANSSTAARKDVRDNSTGGGARAELTDPAAAITLPAGTQAPPVEILSAPREDTDQGARDEGTAPALIASNSARVDADAADDRSGAAGSPLADPAPVATNVLQLRTHNPETHFLNSAGLERLHGCQKPEVCGSSQPRQRLCFNCSLQHDGPTHQAEAG